MKTEKFTGSVGSFLGEKINPPLKFEYTVEQFEKFDELEAAKEVPSNTEIVDFVNVTKKNNERAKAMTAVLTENGYTKPDPNDPIVAAQTMIRNIEKMENMQPQQKQMMVAVLKQQIADIEAKRKAELDAATSTESTPA
jgi:hypothetical protein